MVPPEVFDVLLEEGTVGAVVPGVGETAVDVGAGEDEAATAAERNKGVERFEGRGHKKNFRICLILALVRRGSKKRVQGGEKWFRVGAVNLVNVILG